NDHFVVLYDVAENSKGKFIIADPGFGLVRLSEEEMKNHWLMQEEKGVALFLEPNENFTSDYFTPPKSSKNDTFFFIKKQISTIRKKIPAFLLIVALSSFISWLFPICIQQIVDHGIKGKNNNLILAMVLSQIVMIAGLIVAERYRSFISTNLSVKISSSIILSFIKKLARLPLAILDNKNKSDLILRIEDHSRIETFISNTIVTTVIQAITFIILSVLLLVYAPFLFAIYFFLNILSFAWILSFSQKKKSINYIQHKRIYSYKSSLYEFINGLVEIKINVAQNHKIENLNSTLTDLFSINRKASLIAQHQMLGARIFNIIKNAATIIICSYFVFKGSMTIGIMLAVSYIIGFLNSAIESFMEALRSFQDTILSIKRINEIENKSEEITSGSNVAFSLKELPIIFENVSFSYPASPSSFALQNLCFEIPKNKITAIVGSSGSGKTTLLKLLLGMYQPTDGEIIISGQNLKCLNVNTWREKCGVVLQDGIIFSDSIVNNICLKSRNFDSDKLDYAMKTACIYAFVMTLPKSYHTKIGESGLPLSGGQRQRILIARAVYNNPDFILFDEATSFLDTTNETDIMQNLDRFFINKTVIIIAHRLSTVKNANNIIVLSDGKVVEQGEHHTLSKTKGYYYKLVKNQIELAE
ncbi:MAG TPA: ATP-binding cassette domain-containing protein, partial [Puia sp.]|nr:ATP-binding cassette domain-containing protein [Puia sp.]